MRRLRLHLRRRRRRALEHEVGRLRSRVDVDRTITLEALDELEHRVEALERTTAGRFTNGLELEARRLNEAAHA